MWTKQDIPTQKGKTVIVTGANTGIGFEIALALYEAGAHVIVAGRSPDKIEEAVTKIHSIDGHGSLECGILNLSNLSEIEKFAKDIKANHKRLDILINNAGVMAPPPSFTDDGFEQQFGVNFLGHFALTGHLYALLKATNGARVVNLSSGAHKWAQDIDYTNLKQERDYDPNREYGISKLANLLHTSELQRRINEAGDLVLSVAAHPGVTYTDLQRHLDKAFLENAFKKYKEVMQPWQGALPALFAATSPSVKGFDYYGPDGENEVSGYPALVQISDAAKDPTIAKKLWSYAERITGIQYPVL